MESNTGCVETPMDLTGETKATSKSEEEWMIMELKVNHQPISQYY